MKYSIINNSFEIALKSFINPSFTNDARPVCISVILKLELLEILNIAFSSTKPSWFEWSFFLSCVKIIFQDISHCLLLK
ncbi:MAG: hypothetical protein CM15mP50_2650 [Rhodobacterales bacterium]|nr:MAG: hypothetical protein CM15mP50_2650 [Rhodobacterales bacterium]